ncbi:MAG: leucine-rich repeat protein [Muribaculaceae bacterium]|nr:leucine-rich repeat protein [Muribaculaceae bacterium]
MKRFKLLLSLLMLCCASSALAHDFEVDGIYYNKNGTEATVTYRGTSYSLYSNEYSGSVTIPSSVTYCGTSYSVTSIGNNAFWSCAGLTSVTIPNSVTSIGNSAFSGCTGLTSVIIPNSVTSIGNYAFASCSNLTNLTISSSVSAISEGIFLSCTELTNVTIPNSVTAIGDYAFKNCTTLTSVNIPNSVTSIGSYAFSDCSSLTSMIIPNSVTTIGPVAFDRCSSLTSVTIGNSVTAISNSMFSGCSGLTSVTIPNSATSIGNYAFNNCRGLTSISIPNSVTSIGNSAFSNCSGLTSISIPNSVTAIGNCVFDRCDSLTNITVESGNSTYDSRNNCNAIIETASNTLVIGCKNTIIPSTVTAIGNYAFQNCIGLTNISIPNSITTIGNYAFQNCTTLTSVNIPNSVTSIGTYAFSDCSGLTSVTIGNSVTTIGNYVFFGCSGLISLTIPKSVTSIGYGLFAHCSGLTSITVENGNSIYDSRDNCNAIIETASNTLIAGCKNTTILNSVTAIGFSAFHGCTGLTSVTIPNSVTAIGEWAFLSCKSLTSVTIPNSVIAIRDGVFYLCEGLKSVTIPNSVTSIGNNAFESCISLTSMTIPNSVTTIGIDAFYRCDSLKSVTIGSSITAIGRNAFNGCNRLESLICKADTPPTMENRYVFDNDTYSRVMLYVPEESLEAYQTTDYWNMFTNILSMEHLQDDKFEVNGIYYYIIGDEAIVTYKGTSYSQYNNEYSGSVTIPSTVTHNGITYPVTTIGEAAFQNCTALTSVTIPNSVTSIDKEAFMNCTGLTGELVIPNSVITIDDLAFCYCSGLTNVTFGNSVTTIGENAFSECTSLTSLTLPNSITTIKDVAFAGCTGLTGELVIPNSITNLGASVFVDCSGLTSATIPSSITRISDELFFDCSGLTSVNLPSTITFIGDAAFEGCSGLTSFTIPNAVDSIIYSAFKRCTGLIEIVIPNSVTYLGKHVFSDCTGLTSAIIGSSVSEIKEDAFGGCTSLTSIVVAEDNAVFDSRDNCNGIIETATNKLIVGCKGTVIPNTVTTIGDAAFEEMSTMTSVTIPASVTYIEEYAFDYCIGLTSVICKATTPPVMGGIYVFDYYNNYNTYTTATLYVPAASLQAYRNTDYWNRFTNILPIEDYATDMPTITTELSIGAMTVTASGNGTVVLMVDGVVVENPCDIPRTEQTQVVTVTATAQEEGKLISDIASLEVTIPAILPLNTDNYLSMSDAATVRGATLRIPVRMTNAATIVSFQTDIELDEGLEVVQVDGDYLIEPSDRMTRTHSISSNRLANGNIRVLCYSTNYKAFTGNSGDELFYITVRGTATAEGDYTITLKNTLFTDRDFDELRAPDASATVNVQPYLLGDANGSGTVTVTDVVVTAQRVLEYDPQPFVFEGADVNEDGNISVTDVTRIAYMVLNSLTMHAPMRAPVMWNNGDCLSAADISIAAGETRTVAIRLDNALDYTALQFDLTLPNGLTAANFRLTERATGLSLDMNDVGNGTTRVLCYSPALAAISGHEGVLLTFEVTANGAVRGDITVDGTELVTTGCQTVMLDGFTIGVNGTTGVNEMAAGKTVARVDYFNLAGQQIDCPESGVSIVVTTYTDGTSSTSKIIK